MDSQFADAFSNGLAVAEVAGLHLPQADPDARLRKFVAQAVEPIGKRLASIFPAVTKKFDHEWIVV